MFPDPEALRATRHALLRWFDAHRRAMPWRDAPTPYRVFVSEFMLQQTQVATALPYFERFVARFPDWAALAGADEDAVLAQWSGLGYYRRARSLQAAAQAIMTNHDGALPADPAALGLLPGVGRYTAGAVASIAFGLEEPALDGNGIRLLTRLHALPGDPARQPLKRELWGGLSALVAGERPGDLNQAVMELAATVCRPRNPDCERCPLALRCAARAAGEPLRYPESAARPRSVELLLEVGLFRGEGALLLARGERPFLGGMWNLPFRVLEGGGAFPEESWAALGIEPERSRELGEARHTITRYRLRQRVLAGDACLTIGDGRVEYRWVDESELPLLKLPAFGAKLMRRFDGRYRPGNSAVDPE